MNTFAVSKPMSRAFRFIALLIAMPARTSNAEDSAISVITKPMLIRPMRKLDDPVLSSLSSSCTSIPDALMAGTMPDAMLATRVTARAKSSMGASNRMSNQYGV